MKVVIDLDRLLCEVGEAESSRNYREAARLIGVLKEHMSEYELQTHLVERGYRDESTLDSFEEHNQVLEGYNNCDMAETVIEDAEYMLRRITNELIDDEILKGKLTKALALIGECVDIVKGESI